MSQIPEEMKTPHSRNAFVDGLMTVLGFIVFLLLLPIAIVVWQYDRHIRV